MSLSKEIELYGNRIKEKSIDVFTTEFIYDYESKRYVMLKYKGEIVSLYEINKVIIQ